jgi:hypothetical protein
MFTDVSRGRGIIRAGRPVVLTGLGSRPYLEDDIFIQDAAMKANPITLPLLVLALIAAGAASAADKTTRIKKCQDDQGKWHYGDTADDECARSKVLELDSKGVQRKEIAAPLTEAELQASEQSRADDEKARKLSDDQQRRDKQLLATYMLEDDIVQTRDRKLADIEAQVSASEGTLKSLRASLQRSQAQAADEQRTAKAVSPQTAKLIANNETQIARHEASVQKMKKEQETTRAQFQSDIERFRELKRKAVTTPAAGDATPKP